MVFKHCFFDGFIFLLICFVTVCTGQLLLYSTQMSTPVTCLCLCQADDSDSVVVTADVTMSPKRRPDAATETTVTEPVIDLDNTFPVHVNIERAFHLPMVLENRY